MRLKRHRPGYYETLDGQYILYSYEAEDKTGTWWVAYKWTPKHEEWDEFVSVSGTLRGLKTVVAWDMEQKEVKV